MKKVINLTPHVVNVYDLSNNPVCDIPVSGMPIPRCHQDQVVVGIIDNITITRQSFGDVENLPAPVPTYTMLYRAWLPMQCRNAVICSFQGLLFAIPRGIHAGAGAWLLWARGNARLRRPSENINLLKHMLLN